MDKDCTLPSLAVEVMETETSSQLGTTPRNAIDVDSQPLNSDYSCFASELHVTAHVAS